MSSTTPLHPKGEDGTTRTGSTSPVLLTVTEVAKRWHVSRMTVYRLTASGQLPSLRIGNLIRITTQAISDYENNAQQQGANQ